MENYKAIKHLLLQKCHEYVDNRMANIREALNDAQQAANEETKSSVGDKYNTQRAMMQIERDKHAVQLVEAQKLQRTLHSIKLDKELDTVQLGSLVETDAGNYFIAISMGKVELEGNSFLIISAASPIGQALLDKKRGDQVTFNKKIIRIKKLS